MSGRDKEKEGGRERTFSKPRAVIVHPLEHWILTEAAPGSEEGDREQCRHQPGGQTFSISTMEIAGKLPSYPQVTN